MTSLEKEFIYEVGLTPDEKQHLQLCMGITALSLNDYRDVREQINGMEFSDE